MTPVAILQPLIAALRTAGHEGNGFVDGTLVAEAAHASAAHRPIGRRYMVKYAASCQRAELQWVDVMH